MSEHTKLVPAPVLVVVAVWVVDVWVVVVVLFLVLLLPLVPVPLLPVPSVVATPVVPVLLLPVSPPHAAAQMLTATNTDFAPDPMPRIEYLQ